MGVALCFRIAIGRSTIFAQNFTATDSETLLFFMRLVKKFGISRWSMFQNQLLFFDAYVALWSIKHYREFQVKPLLLTSEFFKSTPVSLRAFPRFYRADVFRSSPLKTIRTSDIQQSIAVCYCVNHLSHLLASFFFAKINENTKKKLQCRSVSALHVVIRIAVLEEQFARSGFGWKQIELDCGLKQFINVVVDQLTGFEVEW